MEYSTAVGCALKPHLHFEILSESTFLTDAFVSTDSWGEVVAGENL